MNHTNNPLTPQHQADVLNAMASLKDAKEAIERARRAGINVDYLDMQHSQLAAQLQAIHREYLPRPE